MSATPTQNQGKAMRRAIRIATVITPARLLRGIAMGAMLIAAIGLVYQELNQGKADNFSSSNQATQAVPAQSGSKAHDEEEMSSNAVRNSTVNRTLPNIELERLDYQADLMQGAAHKNSPFTNRGIDRLEGRIDRLLADAAGDPSKNKPSWNWEIERLDERIGMVRAAARKPTASNQLSNKVTAPSIAQALHDPELVDQFADAEERVYDELSISFVGIPAPSSETIDRLLPVGED